MTHPGKLAIENILANPQLCDLKTISAVGDYVRLIEEDRDDLKSQLDFARRQVAEAKEGFDALEEIDEAWAAVGHPSNRAHLTLSEQISSMETELEGHRDREAALESHRAKVEATRPEGVEADVRTLLYKHEQLLKRSVTRDAYAAMIREAMIFERRRYTSIIDAIGETSPTASTLKSDRGHREAVKDVHQSMIDAFRPMGVIFPGTVEYEISDERLRQVSFEGYDADHDDAHDKGELLHAAIAYLWAGHKHSSGLKADGTPHGWPWEASAWKPRDRRSNLIRAAALCKAEIDRVGRTGGPSSSAAERILGIAMNEIAIVDKEKSLKPDIAAYA